MTAVLLNAPATEPLTLSEAKAFLRVEHTDEDTLIGGLITAARHHVETRTRLRLITQIWRIFLKEWPTNGRIVIPFGPVRDVIAARLRARDGSETQLDLDAFVADLASRQPAVAFVPGTLAHPEAPEGHIELDVEFGFGSATAVPAELRQAVRLLMANWYEHRGGGDANAKSLPDGLDRLLGPYRGLSL